MPTNEDHDTSCVVEFLAGTVSALAGDDGRDISLASFREDGVLKDDEDFTARFVSGPEYHVTVVRSR